MRPNKKDFDFPGIRCQAPGVLQLDVMVIIKGMTFSEPDQPKRMASHWIGMEKMDTYSLKEVAKRLLKDQKKRELKSVLITPSWYVRLEVCSRTLNLTSNVGCLNRCTDDFYRSVVEWYCCEDTHTTGAVCATRKMIPHITELAALTRTTINDLTFRGQQKKTWNQFVHAAHHDGWLLDEPARRYMQSVYGVHADETPSYLKTKEEKAAEQAKRNALSRADKIKLRVKYTGGFVLDPEPDFYDDIVATEDFNSLYPSIIIAHNLCWSTWVEHKYDINGRGLWLPMYGSSFDNQDHSKFVLWRLNELQPDPAEHGNKDIILVVEDWGSVEAAKWIAYQLWQKWYSTVALRDTLVKRSSTRVQKMPMLNLTAKTHAFCLYRHAKKPANPPHHPKVLPPAPRPPPEWKPAPGQVPKTTCCFVVNRKGIFPPILDKLLTQRKAVKGLQGAAKAAGNHFMEGVYEAQQLALKLSANAGYGFTGAVDGFFGGVAIGAATCLLGRHYILLSNITAEYEYYAKNVYGDSVSGKTPVLIKQKGQKATHVPIESLIP